MIRDLPTNIYSHVRLMWHEWRNRRTVPLHTVSPDIAFQAELQQFLGCNDEWVAETAAEYQRCPDAWRHLSGYRSPSARTDGIAKSLDIVEGFAVWSLVKWMRPQRVVELGVQYGISSRLWKEALKRYIPYHELILCDLEDNRRYIDDHEATFYQQDAREILPILFESGNIDLLHNDAHPYSLIHWSLHEALHYHVPLMTFHDVGRGPRGPFKLEAHDLSEAERLENDVNWVDWGHWERHVMGDIFGQELLKRDFLDTPRFRSQIFDSLFGFGAVINKNAAVDKGMWDKDEQVGE